MIHLSCFDTKIMKLLHKFLSLSKKIIFIGILNRVMPRKRKGNIGRPTLMTEHCLHKLKEGFLRGYNNRIACVYAGISEALFYKYCDLNPEFVEKKKEWQMKPLTKAIDNVNAALDLGDVQTSKWLLERKLKDDYSVRTETTGKDGGAIQTKVVYIEKEEKESYLQHIKDVTGKNDAIKALK